MQYTWQKAFADLWERAVATYSEQEPTADQLFGRQDDRELIERIGATKQEIFDLIEDHCGGGEPDFTTAILLTDIRRHYFLERQGGQRSNQILDIGALPAKTDAVEGIEWLPRLIPKAIAKLRGELHPDIMYLCGGDRAFFRKHDIHPAEFLRVVEGNENNPQAIIRWVEKRSAAEASPVEEEAASGRA